MLDISGSILFVLPAYVANAVPVIFSGGGPLDRGMNLPDGKPLFGETKTVFGTLSGVAFGLLVAVAYPFLGISFFTQQSYYVYFGIASGVGAMLGDLLGSFLKRRMRFTEGSHVLFLDQLGFLYVAFVLSALLVPGATQYLSVENVLFLTVLTFFMHLAKNKIANMIALKKVPW